MSEMSVLCRNDSILSLIKLSVKTIMVDKLKQHTKEGAAFTDLILEIFRTNGNLLYVGDQLTADLGLTSARWQVLGAIEDQAITVAHIARNMGLTRQSVQRLVKVLNEDGMVELFDNPHHKRAKLVKLTGLGKQKYEAITQIQISWANMIASGIDVGRLKDATGILQELRKRLK